MSSTLNTSRSSCGKYVVACARISGSIVLIIVSGSKGTVANGSFIAYRIFNWQRIHGGSLISRFAVEHALFHNISVLVFKIIY